MEKRTWCSGMELLEARYDYRYGHQILEHINAPKSGILQAGVTFSAFWHLHSPNVRTLNLSLSLCL